MPSFGSQGKSCGCRATFEETTGTSPVICLTELLPCSIRRKIKGNAKVIPVGLVCCRIRDYELMNEHAGEHAVKQANYTGN